MAGKEEEFVYDSDETFYDGSPLKENVIPESQNVRTSKRRKIVPQSLDGHVVEAHVHQNRTI